MQSLYIKEKDNLCYNYRHSIKSLYKIKALTGFPQLH